MIRLQVEHLSKILRSYDLGKMVPKGNRPDDLIGGTLGYRVVIYI